MRPAFWAKDPSAVRQVHLAPPPRQVSLAARVVTALGMGPQIAWMIFGFLSIFFWVFSVDSEMVTAIEFRGETEKVEGVVTGTRATAASENKRTVRAWAYEYKIGGKVLKGESFGFNAPAPGMNVSIEYLKDRPQVSRIVGMRRRTFGTSGGITAPFSPIALLIAVGLTVRGARRAGLLSRGMLGFARLVEKKRTGARVNKQPVIAYVFELDLPAEELPPAYREQWQRAVKKHRFTFKTHDGAAIQDEPLEPVLYDPARPASGVPLDALSVAVTPDGTFATAASPALRLVLPALAIGGNVLGVLLVFVL